MNVVCRVALGFRRRRGIILRRQHTEELTHDACASAQNEKTARQEDGDTHRFDLPDTELVQFDPSTLAQSRIRQS